MYPLCRALQLLSVCPRRFIIVLEMFSSSVLKTCPALFIDLLMFKCKDLEKPGVKNRLGEEFGMRNLTQI